MPTCPGCREIYGRRTPPEEPPCDDCRVDLLSENREVASVFFVARTQVIAGGFGVVDLNFSAVKGLMDLYGIKDQRGAWEKIHRTWGILHKEEMEKKG